MARPTEGPAATTGRPAVGPRLEPSVAVAAGVLCGIVVVGLCWPMPLHPATSHLLTAFGDSHVWVFDQLVQQLLDGELSERACAAGYPTARTMRAIGLAPLLVFAPLRALVGALAAANLVQMLALPLSAALAALWIRRVTGAPPGVSALLGAAWGLSPTLLGTFATLEISNTQAWLLPALLLALEAAWTSRGAVVLVPLLGALTAFTSPYYALALPFLYAGAAVGALREGGRVVLPRVLIVGLLLAASLALARGWYAPGVSGGGDSIFSPAQRAPTRLGPLPVPAPVASLDSLLFGGGPAAGSVYETVHHSYLGLLLVLAGLAGARFGRGPGRGLGFALTVGGALLAMGPLLALQGRYVSVAGRPLALPVYLLEALQYPTVHGGLYYRYAVLASLGLCLQAARLFAALPRSALWAGLFALLQVGDALRATGPRWPRPSEEVPDLALLERLADDPATEGDDGAVLELPLPGPTDGQLGQAGLLRAVILRRPTTALPRAVLQRAHPLQAALDAAVGAADPTDAAAPLRALGFRFVVLPAELRAYTHPDEAALRRGLGPPTHEGALLLWDLGPATAHCEERSGAW